jgi:hypothetical protein
MKELEGTVEPPAPAQIFDNELETANFSADGWWAVLGLNQ